MPETIEVRFKGNRRDYFRWPDAAETPRVQEAVIVEAERGQDLGRVSAVGSTAEAKCASSCSGCAVGAPPTVSRSALRRATPDEIRAGDALRRAEDDVRRKAHERARDLGLDMKVSDAEWQWDRKKLTLYFTAETRVDFRSLVRELATLFRTRIDLRQIGVRDEAARLGGVGRCGREYCCSTWLTSLGPVSLSLAKDQHLSLNPAQISGGCGRLLCCLKYEHEFYVASRKRFPKEGKPVRTGRGMERVVAVDIFRERVFLRHEEEGPRIIPLVQLQEEQAQIESLPPGEAVDVAPAPPPTRPSPSARPSRPSRPSASRPETVEEAPAPTVETPQESAGSPSGAEQAAADTSSGEEGHRKPKRRRRRRRRRRDGESGPDRGEPPSSAED